MRASLAIFLGVATLCVIADQLTKSAILNSFSLHEYVEVIPGFFGITHIRNTGGAFGLLAGQASVWRTGFFIVVSAIALSTIYYLYAKIAQSKPFVASGLALIFGGAIGNLIDRIRLGDVVDFLDFRIGSFSWPAFNVADSAITVGVVILLFHVALKKV